MTDQNFDFRDQRSLKVVIVSHCILNQNSRIATCAMSGNTMPGVVEKLILDGYGLIQGPCPETELFGLQRTGMDIDDLKDPKPASDGEIYDRLNADENIDALNAMAFQLATTAKEYVDNGVEVGGILGVAGSPSCGVKVTYRFGLQEGQGAFIEALGRALRSLDLDIPIIEMNDARPDKNLQVLDAIQVRDMTD